MFVHYRQTIKNITYTADDSNGHSAYYGGKFRNKAEHGRIYGDKSYNSWIVNPAKFKYTGVYGVWNSFWIAEVITASFSYIMVRRMFKRMP